MGRGEPFDGFQKVYKYGKPGMTSNATHRQEVIILNLTGDGNFVGGECRGDGSDAEEGEEGNSDALHSGDIRWWSGTV